MDLHVSGAFELLENDLVHPASRVYEGGGHDGERTAFLNVSGCPEESLGFVERVGVHAAG